MKKLLQLLFFLIFLSIPIARSQEARDIVKKADEKAKGKTSIANITIQTIRPNWNREMTMKAWMKGNDYALLLFLSPAKEKGVVFLKRKKEVWNWVPSIERNIKMPPSMMSQSWMGTDFTNDDLVKEASVLDDYNHSFLEDTTINDKSCYTIQLLPKPKSAVVWGKLIMYIDKKDFIMLQVNYFDEDNTLINSMYCSDIKMLGGRLLPARMEMIPSDKKGYKTVLIYNSLLFDSPMEDTFFTTQNISKIK